MQLDFRYKGQRPSQSLEVHSKRVFKAAWHSSLPLLISISSDHHIGMHKYLSWWYECNCFSFFFYCFLFLPVPFFVSEGHVLARGAFGFGGMSSFVKMYLNISDFVSGIFYWYSWGCAIWSLLWSKKLEQKENDLIYHRTQTIWCGSKTYISFVILN